MDMMDILSECTCEIINDNKKSLYLGLTKNYDSDYDDEASYELYAIIKDNSNNIIANILLDHNNYYNRIEQVLFSYMYAYQNHFENNDVRIEKAYDIVQSYFNKTCNSEQRRFINHYNLLKGFKDEDDIQHCIDFNIQKTRITIMTCNNPEEHKKRKPLNNINIEIPFDIELDIKEIETKLYDAFKELLNVCTNGKFIELFD